MPNDELGPGVYCCTFTSHTKKIETFRILASIMWIFFRIRIFLEPKAPQRYELIPSACDMRWHVKTSSYAAWNGVSAIVVTYLHPALTQSFANPLGLMSARGGASIGILCKRFGTEATCETLVSHTVTAFRWCHLKSSGFHSQNSCSPSSVSVSSLSSPARPQWITAHSSVSETSHWSLFWYLERRWEAVSSGMDSSLDSTANSRHLSKLKVASCDLNWTVIDA